MDHIDTPLALPHATQFHSLEHTPTAHALLHDIQPRSPYDCTSRLQPVKLINHCQLLINHSNLTACCHKTSANTKNVQPNTIPTHTSAAKHRGYRPADSL